MGMFFGKQSIQHPKKARKKPYYMPLGTWSFGGHLVALNSNLMCAIYAASQKNNKKTYYMPQSEIW